MWQPIKTFDYESEQKRTGTMFVPAWVSDGTRVEFAENWGPQDGMGDDHGWREALDIGRDGAERLSFVPTHWLPKPDAPSL